MLARLQLSDAEFFEGALHDRLLIRSVAAATCSKSGRRSQSPDFHTEKKTLHLLWLASIQTSSDTSDLLFYELLSLVNTLSSHLCTHVSAPTLLAFVIPLPS